MIEGRHVKAMFVRKPHRFPESVRSVVVISKNKSCIEPNVVAAKIVEGHIVTAAHGIEFLLHHAQRFTLQALEADQESLATATRNQVKKLLVVRSIDAGL